MIIVMEEGAGEEQVQAVIDRMVDLSFTVHRSTGLVHTVLGGVGPEESVNPASFEEMPGVKECRRIIAPYKLVSRAAKPAGSIVAGVGGSRLALFVAGSGPKLVEVFDSSQLNSAAVTPESLLYVPGHAMRQRALLAALGSMRQPVILERDPASTVEQLLSFAEMILSAGNPRVILCEAGIRTFVPGNATLDVGAIPVIKKLTHLPVVVDPCKGAGRRGMIPSLARAAVAAGCDGLILHIEPGPAEVIAVEPAQMPALLESLRRVAAAVDRSL